MSEINNPDQSIDKIPHKKTPAELQAEQAEGKELEAELNDPEFIESLDPPTQEGLGVDPEIVDETDVESQQIEEELNALKVSFFDDEWIDKGDKACCGETTGWSDKIVGFIDSEEQSEIYLKANLQEKIVNGRVCLVRKIDFDYVDNKTGMTNRQLMAKGRSPYDSKTGEKIELHHMRQRFDAPFVELTENSEHGDGNHLALHPNIEGSWRKDKELEAHYRREKREHWKTRSEDQI